MTKDIHLAEDEVLVSFDPVSLFTNIPIGEALQVIQERLREDESLGNRPPPSADRVAELLEVFLKSTYFRYGGDFYEQTQGAAMGSLVSVVLANLYMKFFEQLTLWSAPVKPQLWKRCVDDTCCIVKSGMAEKVLDHLNSVRPSIQFTLKLVREGSLPFLDTFLRRWEDGTLDISVYRKPTHTNRYLHFQSHHPTHVRRGLVRCLYDRARSITTSPNSLQRDRASSISTSPNSLQREKVHLVSVLKCNGYPSAFIHASSTPPT